MFIAKVHDSVDINLVEIYDERSISVESGSQGTRSCKYTPLSPNRVCRDGIYL